MKERIISAVVAAIITVPLILLGGYYYKFLILILATLGFKEFITIKDFDFIPRRVKYISYFLFILSVFIPNFIYITFLTLTILSVFINDKLKTKDTFFLIGLITFLSVAFRSLLIVGLNIKLFVYLLSITIIGDTFAMLFGMLIGKHKLVPDVSPKKTIEGSIGGFLIAVIVAVIIYVNIVGTLSFNLILVTSLLAIISQLGDLVFSKFKRDYKIKDFSNIMPGHGGILDRLDSIFFVSMLYLVLERFV